MTLKEANNITKKFTKNGVEYIPALSDDWVYGFSCDGSLYLSSEKLNINISLDLYASYFFPNYIFNHKLLIDGNKLIGEFSFSKYDLHLKDEFLQAQRIVSDLLIIENNELREYGIYIDDKGERFIYLGDFGYRTFQSQSVVSHKKMKKYIISYPESGFGYNSKIIQKTTKRKFVEFVRFLNVKEIQEFKKSCLPEFISVFIKDGFNSVAVIEKEFNNYFNHCFIKNKGLFGFFEKNIGRGTNGSRRNVSTFYELDFDSFKDTFLKDLHNGCDKPIYDYSINKVENFSINDKFKKIQFFCDYI